MKIAGTLPHGTTLGSPLGLSTWSKQSIIDYFTQHPDQQTPAGALAFAAQYDYTIAEIGEAFGYTPEQAAAWVGVTTAAATDTTGLVQQVQSEVSAQTAAVLLDVPDVTQITANVIERVTQLTNDAAAADIAADQSAYSQVQNTADLSASDRILAYFAAHPTEADPQGIRDYMTRTGTTIDAIAAALGISVYEANRRLYSDIQAVTPNVSASQTFDEKTALETFVSTKASGQVADIVNPTTGGAITSADATAPVVTTLPATTTGTTMPVRPATTARPLTARERILAYFNANPSKQNPNGVREYMQNTGTTLQEVADAAGITLAQAQQWMIDGKEVKPAGTINWALVVPLGLAALEFLK